MKSSVFGRGLWCALFAFAVIGCKARTFNAKPSSQIELKPPSFAVIQCLTPQGNGGNWAATLGWIAEEWNLRADQALLAGGEKSWIYLKCGSGGSSGSGAMLTTMSLLQNPKLFADSNGDAEAVARRTLGFYLPSEVKVLSRAMRLLATSSDLSFQELVAFYALLVERSLEGRLDWYAKGKELMGTLKKQWDARQDAQVGDNICSNRSNLEWWKGQAAEPCESLVNFAKNAWAAKNLGPNDVSFRPTGWKSFQDISRKLSSDFTVGDPVALAPLPLKSGPGVFPQIEDSDYKRFEAFDRKRSQWIGDLFDSQLKAALKDGAAHYVGAFDANTFNHRQLGRAIVEDAHSQSPNPHPVSRDVLSRSPEDGFLTITTAKIDRTGLDDLQKVPDYSDLRYVVFGNRSTLEKIASSKLLRKHLESCQPKPQKVLDPCYPRRFVLAVVESSLYALQPSVREPDLMEELIAPAYIANGRGAQHMGITHMLDLAELNLQQFQEAQVPKFEDLFEDLTEQKERRVGSPAKGSDIYFGVAGGWPDRRVTAWMLSYFLDTQMSGEFASLLQSAPKAIFLSGFGKPDSDGGDLQSLVEPKSRSKEPSADKFDTKSVRNMFSTTSSVGSVQGNASPSPNSQLNVNDYIDFQNAYYDSVGAKTLSKLFGVPAFQTEVAVNWDIDRLPAFLKKKSRYLATLSHNGVREGIATEDWGLKQKCQVISDPRLGKSQVGRSQCSRFILGGAAELNGKNVFEINRTIFNKSFVAYNGADVRMTDPKMSEELDKMNE